MQAQLMIAVTTAAMLCASGVAAQTVWPPSNAKVDIERSDQTQPVAIAPAPAAAGGMRVFIDPETRQVRQPTAAELANFPAARPKVGAPFVPQIRANPNGGIAATLDSSFASYTVATRNPDGSIRVDCVSDAKAAADALANGVKSGEIIRGRTTNEK